MVQQTSPEPERPTGELAELLRDTIDLHVHSAPDLVARQFDDLQLAQAAQHWGLRAVVLKSHVESTVGRAAIATRASRVSIFGGLALNFDVTGGISSAACDTALRLGARAIWMPTKSSLAHNRALTSDARQPVSVAAADESGELARICDLVAQADALLGTGHAARDEIAMIARRSQEAGTRLILTHPDWLVPKLSVAEQSELADRFPDVTFERCAYSISPANPGQIPVSKTVQAIRAVGVARNVLSSDLGQADGLSWPSGLAEFGRALLHHGLTEADVATMIRERPAALLWG